MWGGRGSVKEQDPFRSPSPPLCFLVLDRKALRDIHETEVGWGGGGVGSGGGVHPSTRHEIRQVACMGSGHTFRVRRRILRREIVPASWEDLESLRAVIFIERAILV
jgi:hypothetical protein